MAYWKYHLESGDLVRFWYDWADDPDGRHLYDGSVAGIIIPDEYTDTQPESYDDIDLSAFDVKVKSNGHTVTVPMDDIDKRLKKADERETDLPSMSEEFRWDKGLGQV